MLKKQKTVKRFLIRAYAIGLASVIMLTIVLTALIVSYQSIHNNELALQRIEDVINLNKNELLGEIALSDDTSLEEHINILQAKLNVDQISILYDDKILVSKNNYLSRNRLGIVERIVFSVLELRPVEYDIANSFGGYSFLLRVDYASSLYRNFIKPMIVYALATVAGVLLMLGFVLLAIYFEIDRSVVSPLKKISDKMSSDDKSSLENINVVNPDGLTEINAVYSAVGQFANNAKSIALGRSASMIAHDIRNPLSVLKTYVTYKTQTDSDDDDREYSTAAKRSVEKLAHMANDLVDYSKATKIEPVDVNLNTLMNEVVIPEIKVSAKEHKVKIHYKPEYVIIARLDPHKFARVLVNIINNSIQAINHDDGEVCIFIFPRESDLRIEISDNGKGIKAEHISKIFEGFYTHGKKGGSGLGLAYSKQVVMAHNGSIHVESEEEKGATFIVDLPMCIIDCENIKRVTVGNEEEGMHNKVGMSSVKIEMESALPENRHTPKSVSIEFKDKRVLVIDDDEFVRLHWRKTIDSEGGVVVGEEDSPENILFEDKYDWTQVDVALVDYNFPESKASGIEVVEYLKDKGVKEIHMCTGYYDDEAVRLSAFAAGATSVIGKE